MNDRSSDEILYSLCYAQILKISFIIRDRPSNPSKEEAKAQLSICESLFTLAAAAAVRQGMRRGTTKALVDLMDKIKEFIE